MRRYVAVPHWSNAGFVYVAPGSASSQHMREVKDVKVTCAATQEDNIHWLQPCNADFGSCSWSSKAHGAIRPQLNLQLEQCPGGTTCQIDSRVTSGGTGASAGCQIDSNCRVMTSST